MDSKNSLEERLERVKNILNYVSLPIAIFGLWPLNVTAKTHLRFAFYILCHGFHITIEVIDLIMVFGDLQETINNLTVTCFQIIISFRIMSVRFHPGIRHIIHTMDDFHKNYEFENDNEKEIYIEHIEKVEQFHSSLLMMSWTCAILWYFTPVLHHFTTRHNTNNTMPLADSDRLSSVFDMSNVRTVILVYILDIALTPSASWYLAVYSLQFAFINGICGRLACLTYKIKNLKADKLVDMPHFFQDIVERHIKIMQLAKALDDTSSIILLIELFTVTFRIVLVCYTIIVQVDVIGIFFTVNYALYLCLILFCIYGNCYMGENLLFESVNLSNAYSECEWHNMPQPYQKAFVICMLQAQTPLKMTAGNFYVYTLNSFTGILRTCMAYVSMLRTIT